MNKIGRVLSSISVVRHGANLTDIKADLGGGQNITMENFTPSGDDSKPLPGDYLLATNTTRSGGRGSTGYIDPENIPRANEGEKRIYARDPNAGLVVVEMWLKNDGEAQVINTNGAMTLFADGSVEGTNSSGFFRLEQNGDFSVNGVTIDTSGKITSPVGVEAPSIKAAGKELAAHDHDIAWTDPAGSGTSGANN